ncbi:monocarboxylate uptake permease MctP [Pendulispora albinea]|uniref:Sodium:solute symporter n=1 Tax=Pendulispora albinea TaxID=2741071 RepID=A0ABZ2LS27_9BACT
MSSTLATEHFNGVALAVFTVLFLLVAVMGFLAARWRRPANLQHLHEWGLGGRSFGTFVAWFLLGGDLFTAYTFIAVPGLVFGVGALGFFAVPYTIMVWPVIFLFLPRLWSVSHRHGYVTTADFVRGRHGSRALSLAVAITGILATMPYIALQLVGIQVCLDVMGVGGGPETSWIVREMPLLVAFAVLAAYTYSSGLRAPALIAFVKDTLIYLVIAVSIVYLPAKLGGWENIFSAAGTSLAKTNPNTGKPFGGLILSQKQLWPYATLGFGSALALFVYPHAITAVLSTKNRNVIRRNTILLPLYTILLGLIALLGLMALAAGVKTGGNNSLSVPLLFQQFFPNWFVGLAFGAIGIGALVPAAIMSIAAANLFTRNIYREFISPNATPAAETQVSKLGSLLVKFGALVFVLVLDKSFAIQFQLLGGIWILQTFPALVFGLYTRWFHGRALLVGWLVGMVYGTTTSYFVPAPGKPGTHFGGQVAEIPLLGELGYIALTAFAVNVLVTVVLTPIFRALKVPEGRDETAADDYEAAAGDPGVAQELGELPSAVGTAHH